MSLQNMENGLTITLPQSSRSFSPNLLAEVTKERDTLREEYGQLENSYSDLFKRYEKMRENCVILKNVCFFLTCISLIINQKGNFI